ncbi:uncharacterized protein LOC129593996 [Paramacrobiotus metropolitanus]|uniref:uncharacterized protein LOC129593996 n=1 Tax=Paramacrobiotus metropolitanus TaxID=2943436 RepID=UPI002445D569|nr:uncharacterized protein LOC129593996 [Paramacrobiotus metropolitanus]
MAQLAVLTVCILLATLLLFYPEEVDSRGSSGRGGGGRSSSSGRSSGRSSSSRSSWGSSSRSGSSRSSWSSSSSSSRSSWSSPSSSRSSWSSPSSSRSSWSSSPSSSHSSRWGSSSPSGSSSRSSWSSPASSRWSSPSSWSSHSSSSSRWGSSDPSGSVRAGVPDYSAAGRSAVRSAVNRPTVAVRSAPFRPVAVVTNPGLTVINYRAPGYFVSDNGFFNGYLLGRMMSGSSHHYYYYNSYVPYRYNYRPYDYTSTTAPPAAVVISSNASGSWVFSPSGSTSPPLRTKNMCTLARWNMELPFSELPNMALQFLLNDTVSGATVTEKSGFLLELLNSSLASYGDLPVSADTFQLDANANLGECGFRPPNARGRYAQKPGNAVNQSSTTVCSDSQNHQNGVRSVSASHCIGTGSSLIAPEAETEPFVLSINNLLAKYSNKSDSLDLLTDLISSVKACYVEPERVHNFPASLFPCLDFSVDSTQISALTNEDSMFGNEDLCQKHLNPDVAGCLEGIPAQLPAKATCRLNDLTNLLVFARHFYLCAAPVGTRLLDYALNQVTTPAPPAAAPFVPLIIDSSDHERISAYRSAASFVAGAGVGLTSLGLTLFMAVLAY